MPRVNQTPNSMAFIHVYTYRETVSCACTPVKPASQPASEPAHRSWTQCGQRTCLMCKRQNALGRSIPIILVWSSWLRFYRGIAVLLYNGGLSRQEKHDTCKRCVRYVRACVCTYAACEYVRFRCNMRPIRTEGKWLDPETECETKGTAWRGGRCCRRGGRRHLEAKTRVKRKWEVKPGW